MQPHDKITIESLSELCGDNVRVISCGNKFMFEVNKKKVSEKLNFEDAQMWALGYSAMKNFYKDKNV